MMQGAWSEQVEFAGANKTCVQDMRPRKSVEDFVQEALDEERDTRRAEETHEEQE